MVAGDLGFRASHPAAAAALEAGARVIVAVFFPLAGAHAFFADGFGSSGTITDAAFFGFRVLTAAAGWGLIGFDGGGFEVEVADFSLLQIGEDAGAVALQKASAGGGVDGVALKAGLAVE